MESVIVIGPGIVIFTGLLVNCCADFQSSTNRNDLFETLLVIVGSVASKAPFRKGAFEATLPTITSKVSNKSLRLVDDWKSAQQFTNNPVKITIPGPMTITDSIADDYYNDPKKMGYDLALCISNEVKALSEAGCQYIQIDEPVFARKPEETHDYGMENLERAMHCSF